MNQQAGHTVDSWLPVVALVLLVSGVCGLAADHHINRHRVHGVRKLQTPDEVLMAEFRLEVRNSPALASEAKRIGARMGVSPDVALSDLEVVRETRRDLATRYAELAEQDPETHAFFERGKLYNIVHDVHPLLKKDGCYWECLDATGKPISKNAGFRIPRVLIYLVSLTTFGSAAGIYLIRRKIAAATARTWQNRSFRIWTMLTVSWTVLGSLFLLAFEPFDYGILEKAAFGLGLPWICGLLFFAYRKVVK